MCVLAYVSVICSLNQVESLAGIGVPAVRASDLLVLKDVISGKYRFGE